MPDKNLKKKSDKTILYLVLSTKKTINNSIHDMILTELEKRSEKLLIFCLDEKEESTIGKRKYFCGGLFQWLAYFRKLMKADQRLDYVYINDYFVGGFIGMLFSFYSKSKLIFRCGGPWVYNIRDLSTLFKTLLVSITKPTVLFASKKVVYNSQAIVYTGFSHEHKVIYNGVNTTLFSTKPTVIDNSVPKVPVQSDKLRLIFVGNMNVEKGIDILLSVCQIKQDKVEVSLVGDGPLFDELSVKYPFAKFYGRLPKQDLPEIMRQHDIMVLPSFVESLPNVLLEAMACGLPVIATNIFGIPEIVDNKLDGLLISPGSAKELSSAIDYFLQNPSLVETYGQNARKKTLNKFNLDRRIPELCNYFLGESN